MTTYNDLLDVRHPWRRLVWAAVVRAVRGLRGVR